MADEGGLSPEDVADDQDEEDDSLDLLAEAIAMSMENTSSAGTGTSMQGSGATVDLPGLNPPAEAHRRAEEQQEISTSLDAPVNPSILATQLTKALAATSRTGHDQQPALGQRLGSTKDRPSIPATWQPEPAALASLMDMGISLNAAMKALFVTGNTSLDAALSWVCEHVDDPQLNQPFEPSAQARTSLSTGPKNCKMVLVVNMSLNMSAGKAAAQCCHAAVGLYRKLRHSVGVVTEWLQSWESVGETKIVLCGNSAEHLEDLSMQADRLQMPTFLCRDAGRTEIPTGSTTVLSIFGPVNHVDIVTGTLSLLK